MNPSDSLDGDAEHSEIAYAGEDDTAEVIDIDDEDSAGHAADDLDDLELEEDGDEMEEGNAQDDAMSVFSKHNDSVLCVCIDSKTSQLVVSGGQDDVAYVWSLASGDIILQCTGHKDSVHCAGFSHDSSFVATGDMKGMIKVWNLQSKTEVFSYFLPGEEYPDEDTGTQDEQEKEELTWLEWHGSRHDLLAGTKAGEVYLWTDVSSSSSSFQILPGHGSPCTAGLYMPDGVHACTGYEDGTVKFWNLSDSKCVHTFAGSKLGHASQVTCIDCHKNNNIVLTGSTDATALLFNVRSGKVLTRFACGDASRGDSVEAVGFSSCGRFVATATISDRDVENSINFGQLTIWESERFVQRHQCKHESGITRIRWDTTAPIVYTATEEGVVSAWDARNGSLLFTRLGHSDVILDLSVSRDCRTLVTASDDHTVRVFSTQPAAVLN